VDFDEVGSIQDRQQSNPICGEVWEGRTNNDMIVEGWHDAGLCISGRCLATFVIVGAMKSGTGLLMKAMNQHGGVVSGRGEHGGREIHFFGSTRGRANISDYARRFPLMDEGDLRITFDKSPDYMRSVNSLRQLGAALPAAKLIVLLRDPVDRAISEFFHNCRHGRYVRVDSKICRTPAVLTREEYDLAVKNSLFHPHSEAHSHSQSQQSLTASTLSYPCQLGDMQLYYFGSATTADQTGIVLESDVSHAARKEASHGYYAQQLEWILDIFPSNQILLLFHEHMQSGLHETLQHVERFLKLSPVFSLGFKPAPLPQRPTGSGSGSGRASRKRHAQLERMLRDLYIPHNAQLRLLLTSDATFRNLSLPSWLV